MDITSQTVEQLKALCYDQIVIQQNATNNIAIINAELAKRNKEQKPNEKAE